MVGVGPAHGRRVGNSCVGRAGIGRHASGADGGVTRDRRRAGAPVRESRDGPHRPGIGGRQSDLRRSRVGPRHAVASGPVPGGGLGPAAGRVHAPRVGPAPQSAARQSDDDQDQHDGPTDRGARRQLAPRNCCRPSRRTVPVAGACLTGRAPAAAATASATSADAGDHPASEWRAAPPPAPALAPASPPKAAPAARGSSMMTVGRLSDESLAGAPLPTPAPTSGAARAATVVGASSSERSLPPVQSKGGTAPAAAEPDGQALPSSDQRRVPSGSVDDPDMGRSSDVATRLTPRFVNVVGVKRWRAEGHGGTAHLARSRRRRRRRVRAGRPAQLRHHNLVEQLAELDAPLLLTIDTSSSSAPSRPCRGTSSRNRASVTGRAGIDRP